MRFGRSAESGLGIRRARWAASTPPHELRLRVIVVVALVHTPATMLAMVLWFLVAHEGYNEPIRENLVFFSPVAGGAAVASGVALRARRVRAPLGIGLLVGAAAILCVVFALESHIQVWGWAVYLFLALPVPLVFVTLWLGGRVPRPGLRVPVLSGR
ncbi:hypothetical protein J4H86_18855 [Spiractinospora alimapuensis]|uniref:hypothetical protein n=1 Tax=Spiractinospora alimapuensis TaxID=2820884 RepID=UPI001F1CD55F|nr:hypothetical protein [Spiractinospora alimapuensis]QVQ50904.1 hypothetical protein J4H86_18855 [Spiractinospora alimapuensis]